MEYQLVKILKQRREALQTRLCSGGVKDWSEYKGAVGELKSVELILQDIKELQTKENDDG